MIFMLDSFPYTVCESVITLIILVQFDPLVKGPIVDKTSDSCMLEKRVPLIVVGVEFVSIGFMNQH
jgi:hypothetical protein